MLICCWRRLYTLNRHYKFSHLAPSLHSQLCSSTFDITFKILFTFNLWKYCFKIKHAFKKNNLREKCLQAQRKRERLSKWTLFLYAVLPPRDGIKHCSVTSVLLTPQCSGSFLIRHNINLMAILSACQLMCEKKTSKGRKHLFLLGPKFLLAS